MAIKLGLHSSESPKPLLKKAPSTLAQEQAEAFKEVEKRWNSEEAPVRELCQEYGLTQRALADRFGIPLRTIEDWCAGKRKPPEYVVHMMSELLQSKK